MHGHSAHKIMKVLPFVGEQPARQVVVAVLLTPESAAALTWAIQNLCRSGDAVHLVHVVTCLSTPSEVRRAGPARGTLL